MVRPIFAPCLARACNAFLLVFALTQACRAQDSSRADLFPVHIGDIWQYQEEGLVRQSTTVEVINDTVFANGKRYWVFRRSTNLGGSGLHFLKSGGLAALEIFNELGERVRVLEVTGRSRGQHSAVWDGKDEDGMTVPTGIYFCRLTTGNRSYSAKVIVLR